MYAKQRLKILISKKGEIKFIYTDLLAGLLKHGNASIVRVSNVEPTEDGQWQAIMTDGTVLGKHQLRKDALQEEVKYLEQELFGEKGMENENKSVPAP